MKSTNSNALRALPAVHRVLGSAAAKHELSDLPHHLASALVNEALSELRQRWLDGRVDVERWDEMIQEGAVARQARELLIRKRAPRLRRVLNVTGTIIHTNLGRAPLSLRAQQAVLEAAAGYSNLELSLTTGNRGSRHSLVEDRLSRLTGAEAALVVNNNAAAVLLVFTELAKGGEAIVSRGQLVEIGGSFRIPDIMEMSGVSLVEVGTTNKTRLSDYEKAMTEKTRLLVKVHTSNYRIIGFTEQPELADLAALARARGIPLYEDLGSGALFDFAAAGLGEDPTIHSTIDSGADVVSFSGDKLLGASQCGIILGKTALVDRIKRNPLTRALRVDKLTLAALDATLSAYLDPDLAKSEIPVVQMLTMPADLIRERCDRFLKRCDTEEGLPGLDIAVVETESRVGGGALPEVPLASCALRVTSGSIAAQHLFAGLRQIPEVPIIARLEKDAVLFDLRTLLPGEEDLLFGGLLETLRGLEREQGASGRRSAE